MIVAANNGYFPYVDSYIWFSNRRSHRGSCNACDAATYSAANVDSAIVCLFSEDHWRGDVNAVGIVPFMDFKSNFIPK